MIPLLSLLACQSTEILHDGAVIPGDSGVPTPAIATPAGRALDPTLEGDPVLVLDLSLPDRADNKDCTVDVELDGAAGERATATLDLPHETDSASLTWDGHGDDGLPFSAGRVTASAWSECADGSRGSAAVDLAVLRVAPRSVDVGATDPADEVPLAFHKADLLTADPWTITGPELYRVGDDALPAPWPDPDVRPWRDDPTTVSYSVPAGLVLGATPVLTVGLDEDLPAGVTVTLDDAPWVDGLTRSLGPGPAGIGRETVVVGWELTACLDDVCAPLPGSLRTEHELYWLLGPSQLRDASAEGYADGTPWIGTLATTADAVDGATDAFGAMDALRDFVHTDPWLLYDPGDRSYSEYDGSYIYWESITSELSAWLDRQQGLSLYCHSVSCLLSTLGQSWGVDAEQIVLGVGFQTNLARAAGSDSWGRWYFNSHSVATIDDGGHVWDASISVDGDDDPYNEPVTEVAPKGMEGAEYFWRLTYDDIGIVNQGKCRVR